MTTDKQQFSNHLGINVDNYWKLVEHNTTRRRFIGILWKIIMTESCICWVDNKKFEITNLKAFQEKTLSRYFNTGTFQSFQRQLNYYGFKRIYRTIKASPSLKNYIYYNDNFQKDILLTIDSIQRSTFNSGPVLTRKRLLEDINYKPPYKFLKTNPKQSIRTRSTLKKLKSQSDKSSSKEVNINNKSDQNPKTYEPVKPVKLDEAAKPNEPAKSDEHNKSDKLFHLSKILQIDLPTECVKPLIFLQIRAFNNFEKSKMTIFPKEIGWTIFDILILNIIFRYHKNYESEYKPKYEHIPEYNLYDESISKLKLPSKVELDQLIESIGTY